MPCNFPVGTYRNDGSQTYRPCGSCLQCRLGYAKDWAVRCVHEAQMQENNSFITLTYNPENLPDDGSVRKSEISKFMKKLRQKIQPETVRFFGCGEYGKKLNRAHYHLCLFGFDFPDKEIFRSRRRNKGNYDMLYISKMLSTVWDKGFSTIGDVTLQSAGYVARYVTKKITGKKQEEHYKGKEPEFALMSRMPGIGKPWFEKYKTDIYPKDYYIHKGQKVRPPRYYDSLLNQTDPELYQEIKYKRQARKEIEITDTGNPIYEQENDTRKLQKEKYRKLVTTRLERTLENGTN